MLVGIQRLQRMFPHGTQDSQWNALLKTRLYPYQREGVLFAVSTGRSLIADDMGLGKTLQAIAASEVMATCLGVEKILIVCPSSLKYQWKREIERFTHHRRTMIIEGALPKRQGQYHEDALFKIVNYDVIHRDLDVITSWSPDLIILDEAQRIKNWKTRMARSIKQLKSPYAIVLTGTPLENRLEELHSIVAFIDCHHFGPLFRFLHRHQAIDPDGKMTGYKDLHKIGESLQSIMIRRRRSEVLKELPKRIDKNYFVPMTKEQWEIHDENREIVARLISKWRRYHFLSEEDQRRLMRCLQTMRMVCDNTYLIDQSMCHGQKIDELEIQLKEILEDPNVKVVIFSQWLRMMGLVITMLKTNRWEHVFLNGSIPSSKRGDLIKTFHDDPACRIFLSTEAGSTGLNLQNASVVINLDLPWNPAVLEQRISRVHRLGQTQPVRVINFIAENGIEHGMLGLLRFKQSMFSGVLDQGDNEILMTESRFSRFIKTIEETTDSLRSQEEVQDTAVESELAKDKQSAQEEIESAEEINASAQQEPQTSMDQRTPAESTSTTDAIQSFLRLGASFLNQLSESLNTTARQAPMKKSEKPDQPEVSSGIRVHHDHTSGRRSLHISLPQEEALKQIIPILEGFLSLLKR
jgi:SNF2 family DNA or RNA helicase